MASNKFRLSDSQIAFVTSLKDVLELITSGNNLQCLEVIAKYYELEDILYGGDNAINKSNNLNLLIAIF